MWGVGAAPVWLLSLLLTPFLKGRSHAGPSQIHIRRCGRHSITLQNDTLLVGTGIPHEVSGSDGTGRQAALHLQVPAAKSLDPGPPGILLPFPHGIRWFWAGVILQESGLVPFRRESPMGKGGMGMGARALLLYQRA